MNDTRSKAVTKLQSTLERRAPGTATDDPEVEKVIGIIQDADRLISEGTNRLGEIVGNLNNPEQEKRQCQRSTR